VIVKVSDCAEPAVGEVSVAVPVNVVDCDGPPTKPPAGATMHAAPVAVIDASLVGPPSDDPLPPSLVPIDDSLPPSVDPLDDPSAPPSFVVPDGHVYLPASELSNPSPPVAPHPTTTAPKKKEKTRIMRTRLLTANAREIYPLRAKRFAGILPVFHGQLARGVSIRGARGVCVKSSPSIKLPAFASRAFGSRAFIRGMPQRSSTSFGIDACSVGV
jgi:hypothetical protein